MDNQEKGIKYEVLATQLLTRSGFTIIENNYSAQNKGEIDIIAIENATRTLVFVEVKARDNPSFEHPLAALTKPKIRKIIKAAEKYLSYAPKNYTAVRFDVIAFTCDNAEHIKNAFYGYF
ncbi:MAG: YraN family protein [Christensenellaceae bacterium]|nr:YraN family protein [Christensenellaceae bacterium]